MKRLLWLVCLSAFSTGCDTLKGPNQSIVAPAVEGRVVDAVSGEPLPDAGIQRFLRAPSKSDPLSEKGAERLLQVPTVSSDAHGVFRIAAEKGGYLLFSQPGVFAFTLVVRHPTCQTLTTNIDLLEIRPVKTNGVSTVFVGDLPLKPTAE